MVHQSQWVTKLAFKLPSEIHHSASIWPIDFQRATLLSTLLLAVSMTVWALQQWFQSRNNISSNSGKGHKVKVHQRSKWDILCYVFVACEVVVTIILPYASIFMSAFMKQLSSGFHLNNFTLDNFILVISGNGGIAFSTASCWLQFLLRLQVSLVVGRSNTQSVIV